MPEFQLDTAGTVVATLSPATPNPTDYPNGLAWRDLDAFTQGYIEALFFTEYEELGASGMHGDEVGTGFSDLAPETLADIIAECRAFRETLDWKAFEADRNSHHADDDQAGRDFWFTRDHHGVGFWDRPAEFYGAHQVALSATADAFGSVDAYLGDDGKVYLS